MGKKGAMAFWGTAAASYLEQWSKPGMTLEDKLESDTVLALVKEHIKPGGLILDGGCGSGRWGSKLLHEYYLVEVDISEKMLRIAMKMLDCSRCHFVLADVENLPFRCGVMDAVVSIRVFQYLDVPTAFRELMRILNHGGTFVISLPNRRSYMRIKQICGLGPKKLYDIHDVMRLGSMWGATIHDVRTILYLPETLYMRAKSCSVWVLWNLELLANIATRGLLGRSLIVYGRRISCSCDGVSSIGW